MSTLVAVLLSIAAFALLSLREPTARDATPRQIWAAARRRPGRTALACGRVALVAALLALVEGLRLAWWGVAAAAWVIATIAHGIDLLAGPTPLEAS